MKFSGIIAWWLGRGIYLSKLPGFQKKVRGALDWRCWIWFFSKRHRAITNVCARPRFRERRKRPNPENI
jgi:hypothetical protein